MPNFVYPFLYLGNILGIDVTCAVKSDKYLVDVCSDAFHQTVTFGNFGTVGREINPRPNTITDILGLVLVTVLLTLGKNVLHFRFGETNIEGVGLLLLLAFQVLAFIVGKLALVLVGKALVKVGSDLISLLRLSMLRQRIRGANATSLTAASVGGISPTLLRDALNIIGVNILNWYGAVIAQSGRQFGESGLLFHNQSDIIIGVNSPLRTVDTICL